MNWRDCSCISGGLLDPGKDELQRLAVPPAGLTGAVNCAISGNSHRGTASATTDDLLRIADDLMHSVKGDGKNGFAYPTVTADPDRRYGRTQLALLAPGRWRSTMVAHEHRFLHHHDAISELC